MNQEKKAFTLVELIVSITILSVLWTIAFLSLNWYTKWSRNSVRITNLSSVKQTLWIYNTSTWKYPMPTNSTEISYSGWILWYQWTFWVDTIKNLTNMSKLITDPLFDIEYDYSVTWNKKQYQLSTILENGLFSSTPLINQANALSNTEVEPYVTWEYLIKDIATSINWDCYLITVPSLFVNNYTWTWRIEKNFDYAFVYINGLNISKNYWPHVDTSIPWKSFRVSEVLNKCSVDNIDELNLYISKLSVAYQQLNWQEEFKNVIYDFNNSVFKENAVKHLLTNWISVHKDVIEAINNPSSWNIYKDTFTDINATEITEWYINDSLWWWTRTWWLTWSSYQIIWSELQKTDSSTWVLHPNPTLPITSWDSSIYFNVVDFAWWSVYVYLRYTDENNYVRLEVNEGWYNRIKVESGVVTPLDPAPSETFTNNTSIELTISPVSLSLSINNIDKWYVYDTFPIWTKVWIDMDQNVLIDNFTLIYK